MKYCSKCGTENSDDAKFCGKCGNAFQIYTPPPPPPPGPHFIPVNQSRDEVSSGLKTGITIAAIILPFIGIVMGIIYLMDSNAEKKAAGKQWLWTGIIAAVVWAIIFNG